MSNTSDFSKPQTTDTYVNVTAEVNALAGDLSKGLDPATTNPANVPTNAVRWNSANGFWEKFSGTTWGALTSVYNIVAAQASKLKSAVTIAITGDISGSASFDGSQNITITATMPTVNSAPGTAGSATSVPVITTDAKGRVTSFSSIPISYPAAPVTSVFGRTGVVTLGASDVTGALGFTPLSVISSALVTGALGYTPPQPGGTGASGTWPISINGSAALLGGYAATSFAQADFVNQSISLLQNFGTLNVGGTRSTGSPSYYLWTSDFGSQGGRGVYYTNMFYMASAGKSTYAVNVGNCRITLINYITTKSIQINLSAVINFASDDSYAFQIYKNGSYVGAYGTYTARGVQSFNFGTFAVAPNTTTYFDLYASILGGSGSDSILVNSFTATYLQLV